MENTINGLVVSSLSHAYGQKKVLDEISFSVVQGQFCALLGPNGAGKSTLFSLATRLIVPHSGNIEIVGVDINVNPRNALAKIGVVFQQPTLDLDLTVLQNLRYFAALHGISGKIRNEAIERSLSKLGMLARKDEKVRLLNGGHKRRMEIARALIHNPKVMLLDEPTVGLDASSRASITEHVHKLASEDGITVLWATHLVDEIKSDDQLVILHEGKIIADDLCGKIIGKKTLAEKFASLTKECAI